jgi:hypothetical protein
MGEIGTLHRAPGFRNHVSVRQLDILQVWRDGCKNVG